MDLVFDKLTLTKRLLQLSSHYLSLYFKQLILCLIVFSLVGCSTSNKKLSQQTSIPKNYSNYICQSPNSYRNKIVGDGSCVSLIKQCSLAPDTRYWSAGEKVLSLPPGAIPENSIIATFKNGTYPSVAGYHAAIYISHDENGIWVWDQWVGKPVHKRLIRLRSDKAKASNTAQAYRLVK